MPGTVLLKSTTAAMIRKRSINRVFHWSVGAVMLGT